MRRASSLLGLLVVPVAVLSCRADDPERTARATLPVLDGTDDTAHPAVVAVDTVLPTGEELCTGYVFMPDLVLTARHCAAPVVDPSSPCGATPPATGGVPVDPSKILIATDAVLEFSSKTFAVAEVTVVPDSTGKALCGNDLAVLRLAAPLEGITPLALRVAGPPVLGEPFTAIGYGTASTSVDNSGRRRERAGLAVELVGASARTVDGEWIADTGPCAGDSGSPALGLDGGSFGVMSRGNKGTCKSMIYERLDVHADFLVDQAKQSAVRLGVPLPAWAGGETGAGGAGGSGGHGGEAAAPPAKVDEGCSVSNGSATSDAGARGLACAVIALAAAASRRRRTR